MIIGGLFDTLLDKIREICLVFEFNLSIPRIILDGFLQSKSALPSLKNSGQKIMFSSCKDLVYPIETVDLITTGTSLLILLMPLIVLFKDTKSYFPVCSLNLQFLLDILDLYMMKTLSFALNF